MDMVVGIGIWVLWIGIVVVAVVISIFGFDRYRSRQSTGPTLPTSEVFIDPSTGQRQRVHINPATGEREYRDDALGNAPVYPPLQRPGLDVPASPAALPDGGYTPTTREDPSPPPPPQTT